MKNFLVVSALLAIAGIGVYELYPHFENVIFPPTPPPPPNGTTNTTNHNSNHTISSSNNNNVGNSNFQQG